MKRLILLRHAKAESKNAPRDFDRKLAPRGRSDMVLLAEFMTTSALRPDLAFVSPAARTRETWGLAALPDVPTTFPDAIYDASPETLLDLVRAIPGEAASAILVGHNPGIEELAQSLVARTPRSDLVRLASGMPTAALAVIDLDTESWRDIKPGSGRLASFETPETLGSRE